MARTIGRDELTLILEELDRGEAQREELQTLVESLELAIGDTDAIEILQDEELSVKEVVDELVGYDARDV